MTGAEIKDLRLEIGWSAKDLGTVLGVHEVTVFRWERCLEKEAPMNSIHSSALSKLGECRGAMDLLSEVREVAYKEGCMRAMCDLLNLYERQLEAGKETK